MDPATEEQLDYGNEEYGGSQKTQYHQGEAIPALAEEEMLGEDDEYDDLYNDVNVGEGFLQMQAQMPPGAGNSEFQTPKPSEPRAEAIITSQETNNTRAANESGFAAAGAAVQFPEQNTSLPPTVVTKQTSGPSERERLPEISHNLLTRNLINQEPANVPHKTVIDRLNNSEKIVGFQQIPTNQINTNPNVNMNRTMGEEYMMRPCMDNGNPMLFVGELHWWTTDAEIESVLIQYGKVKEIKFFDERASGKSKGYCQVEFHDSSAASACMEGMNGHVFNGRACVVTFATAHTIKQMGASYTNKNQGQTQPQQLQGRNHSDGVGRGNGPNYTGGGDGGRNFGRGGWGRGNQMNSRGPGGGAMRGRGGMGNRNMMGNAPNNAGGGGNYGQGFNGPGFGGPPGMMHPQDMMGPGFDIAFMGRGAGYGGFSGPGFPGMMPPFQGVNAMGLPGVAPHVNPAFFGRGMAPNVMGMMGNSGMGGQHSGMWNDANMIGWGGEEHGRESSYAGEDNGSEYGHGEVSHDKGVRSSAAPREKERNSERDWSSNPPEKKHREEKERDWSSNPPEKKHRKEERDVERYDSRDVRYREEKDRHRGYRHKDRDSGHEDDWDRRQSSRSRSRSGAVAEDGHRSRSRDADYGKRRHMPSE